jgi:hypothetical protein
MSLGGTHGRLPKAVREVDEGSTAEGVVGFCVLLINGARIGCNCSRPAVRDEGSTASNAILSDIRHH